MSFMNGHSVGKYPAFLLAISRSIVRLPVKQTRIQLLCDPHKQDGDHPLAKSILRHVERDHLKFSIVLPINRHVIAND